MDILEQIVNWGNLWGKWLFLAGLLILIGYHWYCWRHALRTARQLRAGVTEFPAFSRTPQVSVLVPAWNEAATIKRHVQSFQALRYPRKELLLCAGGEDGTLDRARRLAGKQVIVLEQGPGEGKQGALRKCLARSHGKILVLTDADDLLDDESFERILAPLILGKASAASGMTRPLPEQMNDPFAVYQWFGEQYAARSAGTFVPLLRGCNAAIGRKALEAVAGFDEAVAIGTDDHLSGKLLQQGIRICFVRESQVSNEYPADLSSYFLQQSRWLRVGVLRGLKHRSRDLWQTILGFVVYFLPLLLLGVTPLIGRIGLYGFILVLLHMLSVRLRIVAFGEEYTGATFPRKAVWKLGVYLCFDFYVRVVTAFQLLRPRHRMHW